MYEPGLVLLVYGTASAAFAAVLFLFALLVDRWLAARARGRRVPAARALRNRPRKEFVS
jgi:hypothetical protein